MLLLNRAQREMLVDKLPDVANLAIGALSFGQFPRRSAFLVDAGIMRRGNVDYFNGMDHCPRSWKE